MVWERKYGTGDVNGIIKSSGNEAEILEIKNSYVCCQTCCDDKGENEEPIMLCWASCNNAPNSLNDVCSKFSAEEVSGEQNEATVEKGNGMDTSESTTFSF